MRHIRVFYREAALMFRELQHTTPGQHDSPKVRAMLRPQGNHETAASCGHNGGTWYVQNLLVSTAFY